jgi:hypothetical protein
VRLLKCQVFEIFFGGARGGGKTIRLTTALCVFLDLLDLLLPSVPQLLSLGGVFLWVHRW